MISFCWLPPDSARAGSAGFGRTHVEALDDVGGAPLHFPVVHHHARGDRRPVVHAENGVLVEAELEQQSASVPIFGNVRDAALASRARIQHP